MQPPTRTTRSKANPGLVDRPGPRRSSTIVAQEKAKRKHDAASKAEELRKRTARVHEVEKEVKKAQAEAQAVRQRGEVKVTKKTFLRPSGGVNAIAADRDKRDNDSADLTDPELIVVKKAIKVTKSSSPHTHRNPTPNKPSGLAGTSKSATARPATTTSNEADEPSTFTEDEEVTDDLEFNSAGSKDSLVSISSATTSSTTSVTSTSRPGVRSLPPNVQRSFSDHFAPHIIAEMGCSTSPWSKLDADTVQRNVRAVYPEHEYTVTRGDGFHSSANNRITSFRHAISTAALTNVQSYLTRYTQDQTESYIRSGLLYYGEIPFLYRVFDPTNVRSGKEKGGYKVVRHGIFQHQMIIDTMLVYYGRQGTKACIPAASVPGENPIGALALVCTAVERALSMHTLGFFIKGSDPFSEKYWGHRTPVYLKLANDMTDAQWARFYGMLCVHEKIQDKLKEFNKPTEQWTNDPDEYFIAESDPIEE